MHLKIEWDQLKAEFSLAVQFFVCLARYSCCKGTMLYISCTIVCHITHPRANLPVDKVTFVH